MPSEPRLCVDSVELWPRSRKPEVDRGGTTGLGFRRFPPGFQSSYIDLPELRDFSAGWVDSYDNFASPVQGLVYKALASPLLCYNLNITTLVNTKTTTTNTSFSQDLQDGSASRRRH